MPTLPRIIHGKNVNESPHILILGAGASRAAFPKGDRRGIKPPLMSDFTQHLNLEELLESENINYKDRNFEDIYDEISLRYRNTVFLKSLKGRVHNYFAQMRLPEEMTLYDRIVLSLRKKDLIATFNWDPYLSHAYSRNVCIKELPEIIFLHGNVSTGICLKDRMKGFMGTRCTKCGNYLQPTELLYPIKDKNYRKSPFINNEWKILEFYLEEAYFLTIFGYSAPKSDINAKDIMKKIWEKNRTKDLAQIEIIDIKPSKELHNSWKDFIVRSHYGTFNSFDSSWLSKFPRRSCEALSKATLELTPIKENPIPKTKVLKELHDWMQPFIDEEISYREKNKGFSCLPYEEIKKKAKKR